MAFVVASLLRVQAANPDRPDLTEVQIKGLREKNIFSPFRTKPFPKKPEPGSGTKGSESAKVEAPSRPKPLMLTGIVYDESSKGFQAIVEDKNDEKTRRLEKPRFLKAGEEVLGIRIEAVEKDKVTVVLGETRKELAAGDSLPETPAEGTPGSTATPTAEPKPPPDPAATNSVLEELKKKNKKKDRAYDEP